MLRGSFPSWAPHEVMPISCPSKRFTDSRFAINYWVYRARTPAAP
jgi:Rps23 Pro-64 3,4-dihydroxylase Tpa1-like proline 4-hydroxylase